jgi:hypothetical protein
VSDVNILISIKNLASGEIKNVEKGMDSLIKKTTETADKTTRDEKRAAREAGAAQKQRQKDLKDTEFRLKALKDATKFLFWGGSGITGGLLGTAGLFAGMGFAKLTAESDNVRISFQNTFGNRAGSILDSIRTSTKGIVDDTTLMKDAIQTNMAGIRDVNMLPEIFKLGAVASQRLGISAEEGIDRARKAVVEFNEGAMEQLGIINKLDPSYRTQMAIIEKSTKGLGQYLSIQTKLAYVIEQMRKRYGDNYLVLETNLQAFQFLSAAATNLRNNIGYLVGDAFAPLARGIASATTGIMQFIQQIRTDKYMKETTMTVLRFAGALGGLIAGLAAARFAIMGIMMVFSGPFGLIGGLIALVAAVKLATSGTEGLVDGFKNIANMAAGVYQLVTSFYALHDGTAQINKDLADKIGPQNLAAVIMYAQEAVNIFTSLKNVIEGAGYVLSPLVGIATDLLNVLMGTDYTHFTDAFKTAAFYTGEALQNLRGALQYMEGLKPGWVKSAINWRDRMDAKLGMGPLATSSASSGSTSASDVLSSNAYTPSPTASTQSSLENMGVPQQQQAPPQVTVSAPPNNLAPILNKIAGHMQSIDDKTKRPNFFEKSP